MNYQLAIETYQSILNDFAGVYQLQHLAHTAANTSPVLDRAKKLALPAVSGQVPKILSSIMGSLLGDNAPGSVGYYVPQEITANQSVEHHVSLPVADVPADLDERRQTLWTNFVLEYDNLFKRNLAEPILEANLHALLQRFCWALPAPVASAMDVSLFDYARISAALAVCLAETGVDAEEPALLIGADLSGVQDFLYTLSSDGAAKSLRGRSVYLQLLMEVIALDLLHELALPAANLLYVGGGNFYLIASPSQKEQIKTYQEVASRRLLLMHEGALYLAMTAQPIKQTELQAANMGEVWGQVADALSIQKAQRFSELDEAEMAQAIGSALHGTGVPDRSCRVCQRQMVEGEKGEHLHLDENGDPLDDERKCNLCKSFDVLGRDLSTAQFLALSRIAINQASIVTDWSAGLRHFGFDVQILKDAHNTNCRDIWRASSTDTIYISFWQGGVSITDFPGNPKREQTIWCYRPLAQCPPFRTNAHGVVQFDVNGYPILEDFDKLACNSDGLERWGVLRMDVDRLGTIFQDGMKPNASLSRVVSLSGLMRLFFEGYLPKIAEQFNQPARARVHLMYAGGDDLFIVGSWSILPELAKRIRDEFDKFACKNSQVTLSGGISIAPSVKYPLYQAAEDAEKAEKQSKRYGKTETTKAEKDALTLLSETITWKEPDKAKSRYESFDWVRKRVQALTEWTQGDDVALPRSFVTALRTLDAEWRDWKKREQGLLKNVMPRYGHTDTRLFLGPWQWNLVYSLHRAAQRAKNDSIKPQIQDLVNHIISGEITTIGLSARWLEYLTREGKEYD